MYKNRGKPEDPWNRKAADQVKALAEAIQITNIQQNGVATKLKEVPSSIIARQKELSKRRNNYEEFKQTYSNKLRGNINRERLSQDLEFSTRQNFKMNEPINLTKRLVNSKFYEGGNNKDREEVGKGTMLRAPLGAVKTINVAVPARYKEQAIFSPPKSGAGETFSFPQQLQTMEMLGSKYTSETQLWKNNLTRELESANAEVDVGSVQLEQISKLLEASKTITGQTNKRLSHKDRLFALEQQKIKDSMEKVKTEPKKNKLLLTLNDIDQRLQKLQMKFFKQDRCRYKCIKTPFFLNKSQKSVEVLYKNKSYPLEAPVKPPEVPPLLFRHKMENLPTEMCTQTDKKRANFEDFVRSSCEPEEKEIMEEILEKLASPNKRHDAHNARTISKEPEILVVKEQKKFNAMTMDDINVLDDLEQDDEGNQELDNLILKSNYLMQEFNLEHKKGTYLTDERLWNTKTAKPIGCKSNFHDKTLQGLGRVTNTRNDYKRDTRPNFEFEFALKDSLFCLDNQ